MAEKRNVFIKSKMNKDLDDRLIPDGEYRDAYNVTISKSEGQNVGAVEESPGNLIIPGTDSATAVLDSKQEGVNAIGEYVDEENNRVFIFYSNYCDSSTDNNDFSDPTTIPAFFTSGGAAAHAIAVYNTVTKDFTTLVSGSFLNFSISSPIIGVDLVENLLFWTDNRNQPRKINVDKALEFPADSPTPYYTTEDQISVAKYYPYNPIRLWDYVGAPINDVQATMKDKFNEYYPANVGQSKAGRYTNPTYDSNYAGDPKYLEDKFVRFSYRFKFEDNEYSLMAPFTQEAFIPKQDGFFMSNVKPGNIPLNNEITSQEQETYESTVVPFMENKVNFIDLHIDLPDTRQNLKQNFKIKEIEILYKESDSNNIKVIDTVEIDETFQTTLPTQSYHIYPYNSTKPVKTLPEKQTTRVWDRVPVKAKTQSIVGNRVVYANYVNRQPYPKNIDFLVGVSEKFTTDRNASPEPEVSRVEYPNHTLKQNRSYEVGVVLVDRYGRHSSVINAEPVTQTVTAGGVEYGSETVYHKYTDWQIGGAAYNVLDWTGDSLKLLWQTQIATSDDKYKGLYDINNPLGWYSYKVVVKQREQDYYNVYLPGVLKGYPSFTPDDYFDGAYTTPTSNEDSDLLYHVVLINDNINKIPRNLSEVGPEQREFGSTIRLFGRVGMKLIGDPGANITATGYKNHNIQFFPAQDGMQSDQVTQIGTMKDLNIGGNKVVVLTAGPYANPNLYTIEYNPDVEDYMKIALPPHNVAAGDTIPEFCYVYNHRENPEYDPNVAVASPPVAENCRGISTLVQTVSGLPGTAPAPGVLNDQIDVTAGNPVLITNPVFYSSISDPLIARISGVPTDDRTPPLSPAFSSREMGIAFDPYAGAGAVAGSQYSSRYFEPLLTVYETQAFVSNLDIFYETTSSGLISELNTAIEVSTDPAEVSEWNYSQAEDDAINTYVTSEFDIRDSGNNSIAMNSVTLLSVTKAGGALNITNDFEILNFAPNATFPNGYWRIRTKSLFYYGVDSQVGQTDLYRFTLRCEPTVGSTVDLVYTGALSNRPPVLDISGLTLNVTAGGSLGAAIATSNGANVNDVRNKNDLSFKFIQQFWLENNQQGTFFEFNESPANNYNISALSTTQPGTYTLTLGLTDCAGQGIEVLYPLTVNVLEATLTGGITAAPNEIYNGTQPLWFGGSVYFVNSPLDLHTGFNDKSGSVYRSLNSGLPVSFPATYRSIPLNEPAPGYGTFTEVLPAGNYFRGDVANFIGGTLGDAIDNSIGGTFGGAQSGVKYEGLLYDFNTATTGELTNQVIVNNGGLDGGTVFFEVEIRMQNAIGQTEHVDRQNFFQPVRIQYRPNSTAPWQEALDLNGETFKGAIWDVAENTAAGNPYGKKAALISYAPPKVNEVKYNTDDIVDNEVTTPIRTGVYNQRFFASTWPIPGSWYAMKPAWAEQTGAVNFNSTQQFLNPVMTLRNYGNQNTSTDEGVISRTFATNAVGEYRIVNGNLRCSLAPDQYNTSADNPNIPAWFQGGKVLPDKDRVKFNVTKGDFNAITADIWYEYRIRGNYNNVQEAGQNSLEVNPYGNLAGGTDWPNTGGGDVVYAKSPVFRYVKQFYTRSGTAGNYVYAKYNSVNNKYYAYTEPSGAPVDAGAPTGGENAFGAVKTGGLTGCWPTWVVKLDNEGGVITTPRPLAVWDLLSNTGTSIKDDGKFFTWYCNPPTAPVGYNGTCS